MECASLWTSVSLPDMAVAQIQSQKCPVATASSTQLSNRSQSQECPWGTFLKAKLSFCLKGKSF